MGPLQIRQRKASDHHRGDVVHFDHLLDDGLVVLREAALGQQARRDHDIVDAARVLVGRREGAGDIVAVLDVAPVLRAAEGEDVGAAATGDIHHAAADAIAAAENDQRPATQVLGIVGSTSWLRDRRRCQLKELVRDEDIHRVSDLDVVLGPVDDLYRYLGEVREHDAAIVGGVEVRVLPGQLVSLAYHGQPETLRRLTTPETVSRRDLADHAIVNGDDRVSGREGDIDGLVGAQRIHGLPDNPRGHQGAYRIVEHYVALIGPQSIDRNLRRVATDHAAREDLRHFPVRPPRDDLFRFIEEIWMHDDDDLVDFRCCIHGRHRVLKDRLTGDLEELLRDVQTDSGTSATRQDNA